MVYGPDYGSTRVVEEDNMVHRRLSSRVQRSGAVVLFSFLGMAAACLAVGRLRPHAKQQRGELLNIDFKGNPWAKVKLADVGTWLQTRDVKVQPLPAYNADGNSETDHLAEPKNHNNKGVSFTQEMVLRDVAVSKLSRPTIAPQVSTAKKVENSDVAGLTSLRRATAAGHRVKRVKSEQKQPLAHATAKEPVLKRSVHKKAAEKSVQRSTRKMAKPEAGDQSSAPAVIDKEGQLRRAEDELHALEKQEQQQEKEIKERDQTNIQALKMEEEQARKDETQRLAALKKKSR